jgi:hypothetical protein
MAYSSRGCSLLVLQLDRISAAGKYYNIQTDHYKKQGSSRGKNTAEKVGGGAGIGALIGALPGGGKGAAIGAAAGGGLGARGASRYPWSANQIGNCAEFHSAIVFNRGSNHARAECRASDPWTRNSRTTHQSAARTKGAEMLRAFTFPASFPTFTVRTARFLR